MEVAVDQCFQQIVKIALDPFSQNETVISGKAAGVMTTPQNQVVGFGDDGQLLGSTHAAAPCCRVAEKGQFCPTKVLRRLQAAKTKKRKR